MIKHNMIDYFEFYKHGLEQVAIDIGNKFKSKLEQ